MHLVIVHDWKNETPERAEPLAQALGATLYDVQQRMHGGSPAVLASFADPQEALHLVEKLSHIGIVIAIIDVTALRARTGDIIVHRFELRERSLLIEAGDGKQGTIPYNKIEVLLPCTITETYSETVKTTKKKFSLGKTILAGGIPLSKKVETTEEVTSEKQSRVLYLYVTGRTQPIIFFQDKMSYDGLGEAMQVTRSLNFSYLVDELHKRSGTALFDDRLLKRIEQSRILGPMLPADSNLDIAIEILSRNLRRLLKNQ